MGQLKTLKKAAKGVVKLDKKLTHAAAEHRGTFGQRVLLCRSTRRRT